MFASTQPRVQSLRFKVQGWLRLTLAPRLSVIHGLLRGSSAVAGSLHVLANIGRSSQPFDLRFRISDCGLRPGGKSDGPFPLTLPSPLGRGFARLATLLVLLLPSVLLAQTTSLSAEPGIVPVGPMPDAGWLVLLAQKEPWVTTIIALMGAFRLLLKPIFAALHAFALATGNERVEAMAARIAASRGLRIFAFLLDWVASVKLVPPVKVVPSVGASERQSVGASISPVDPWPAPPPPLTSSNSSKTPNP